MSIHQVVGWIDYRMFIWWNTTEPEKDEQLIPTTTWVNLKKIYTERKKPDQENDSTHKDQENDSIHKKF